MAETACPLCHTPMQRQFFPTSGRTWMTCLPCEWSGSDATVGRLAALTSSSDTPERSMVLVESLLRQRGVYEVAFTNGGFRRDEETWTYLEVKPSLGRSMRAPNLLEAWQKLIGKAR